MGSVMKCVGICCYDKNKQQFVEELRHERVAPRFAGVQDRKHLAAPCKKWTNPHRYILKI